MIPIQKNIPVPPAAVGRKRLYPFQEMEVGDSFFQQGDNPELLRSRVAGSASVYGKASGKKFISRIVQEDSVPGIRVWRIA